MSFWKKAKKEKDNTIKLEKKDGVSNSISSSYIF